MPPTGTKWVYAKKKEKKYSKPPGRPTARTRHVEFFKRKCACAVRGVRTHDLSLARNLLYHPTYASLVIEWDMLSFRTIPRGSFSTGS